MDYRRPLGQGYSAALAFHILGEQLSENRASREKMGKKSVFLLAWYQLLLQVLSVSAGFDLVGICP